MKLLYPPPPTHSRNYMRAYAPIFTREFHPYPGWPPLAFVSRALLDEIISIYLGNNKFIIGMHRDKPFSQRSIGRDAWQRHLGEHARKLRDVTLVTFNLDILVFFHQAGIVPCLRRMAMRAMYDKDDTLWFSRTAISTPTGTANEFCVCDVLAFTADEGMPDGWRLLELLKEWTEGWKYTYPEHRRIVCEICQMPKLERARQQSSLAVDGKEANRSQAKRM